MKIVKYGEGRRQEYAEKRLSTLSSGARQTAERLILLPIPTTRDGVHLSGCKTLISDVLWDVTEKDAVVGYAITREDREIIEASGGVCIDLSCDEIFLAENATLTALGAVGYVLTELSRSVDELIFGIVGYGRIGERVVAYLTALGADVVVYTSKNATRVALGACGIRTEVYDRGEGVLDILPNIDVLINTAPIPLGRSFREGVIPDGLSVIELASGNNFEGVEGVVRLPSLPERVYPDSAAEVYYRALLRGLEAI